jgi:hypothetical protein
MSLLHPRAKKQGRVVPAKAVPAHIEEIQPVKGRFPVKMDSMDGKVLLAESEEQARFLKATDEAVIATSR